MALWAFVAVGVSGVANALIRLDGVDNLFTTQYGAVVLIKVIAFVALGLLGWAHRRHTLPQVEAGVPHAFTRLAAVEAAIMVTTIGVAVGLAATAPPSVAPPPLHPRPRCCSAFPMPDAPSVIAILTGWRSTCSCVGVLLAAAVLYGRGMLTMRRRGDRWPVGRTIAWYAGLAVLAFGTLSGLAVYGRASFSMHMTQHMTLSMIAPLLLVLGAPITLALRALPAARSTQPAGPREWLLAALQQPVRPSAHPPGDRPRCSSSARPTWSTSAACSRPRCAQHWAHELMHVHFVLVGYLFYESLIGTDPIPYRAAYPMRMVTLFAALSFHAFFAVALMSSDAVIAGSYYETLDRPWWPDLLEDQTSGAAFAWAFGELPGVLVLVVLLYQWSRDDDRQARREDRQADRDDDAELRGVQPDAGAASRPIPPADPQTGAGRETPMPLRRSAPKRAISRSMSSGVMRALAASMSSSIRSAGTSQETSNSRPSGSSAYRALVVEWSADPFERAEPGAAGQRSRRGRRGCRPPTPGGRGRRCRVRPPRPRPRRRSRRARGRGRWSNRARAGRPHRECSASQGSGRSPEPRRRRRRCAGRPVHRGRRG